MDDDRTADLEFYKEFGLNVRRARLKADLTQSQLAEKFSLSRSSIANIEKGRQRLLLHQLQPLAEALNVRPESLLPKSSVAQIAGQFGRSDVTAWAKALFAEEADERPSSD